MKQNNNKIKKTGGRLILLTGALFLMTATRGVAQCPGAVDLEATGVGANPTQVGMSPQQKSTITVIMGNNGPTCAIPTGEALAQVTISSVYFDLGLPIATANFTSLCPGQWTLVNITSDATQHNLFFRNNGGPIPVGGPFCGFTFDVRGKNITPPGVPADITVTSSLSFGATSNDPNTLNQNASAQMVVTAFILPVVVSDVSATSSSCNGIINWKTASEQDVDRFEVEFSKNSVTFQTVGTVKAQNAANGATYKYVNDQGTGRGFYRLKIVDRDGKITYSKIVSVDTKCTGVKTVSIYPNPLTANQNLTLVASGYEGAIKGELLSMSGQVVKTYTLKNGTNTLTVEKLAQATYMLRVTDAAGSTESYKVVIVK